MHQSTKLRDFGGRRSLWMRTMLPSFIQGLEADFASDVCVVGAGIAGLTTALRCLSRGYTVTVLDGGTVGGGETLRTSAHLASALDNGYAALERVHGPRGARLIADAHQAAIDWIETFCSRQDVNCGFARVDGFLYGSQTTKRALDRELRASRRAGLRVEMSNTVPLPEFGGGPVIRFADQAQIDPGAYIAVLARAVANAGGRIHEHVLVERIEEGEPENRILTRGGRIGRSPNVVIATNAPLTSFASIPMKQAAYRSYVIAVSVPEGRVRPALYWDMEDPYHYVRVDDGAAAPRDDDHDTTGRHDLLLVGGEDHKTGQEHDPSKRFEALEKWTRDRFSYAGSTVERWSGQIMEPADGIGFVGRNPGSSSNVFIITGDSGDGLTLGTLGAQIVADRIEGMRNAWADVFDPSRSMMHAASVFLRENANAAAQYTDLVAPGDVSSERDVSRGEGAVVRDGPRLVAVFRDEHNGLHACSAICPHLDGVVHWNAVEKSWDCPCHGSRFDPYGHLIIGPATGDLGNATIPRSRRDTVKSPGRVMR